MSRYNKIQQLKADLIEEMGKPNPDTNKIKQLKQQIILLGLGLTGRDINVN